MARRLLATAALTVLTLLASASPALGAWTWPVRGEVITPYLNGDDPYAAGQHRGIDIAGRVGAPVVAAAAGAVRFAGTAGSSGLTVSVRTDDGRFDLSYLHLSALTVQRRAAGRRGRAHRSGGHHRPPLGRAAAPPLRGPRRRQRTRLPRPSGLPAAAGQLRRLPRPGPSRSAPPAPVALRPAPAPRCRGRYRRRAPAGRRRSAGALRSALPGWDPRPRRRPPPPRARRLPPAHVGHPDGLDIGWIAACAGALGASLVLLTARGRGRRRPSPGGRRGAASSIGLRVLLRHHPDLLRER